MEEEIRRPLTDLKMFQQQIDILSARIRSIKGTGNGDELYKTTSNVRNPITPLVG
jgi:hypothetical protein